MYWNPKKGVGPIVNPQSSACSMKQNGVRNGEYFGENVLEISSIHICAKSPKKLIKL